MKSPYRVLYVVRPAEGGMRRHVLDLINNIDRERFRIVLAAPGNLNLQGLKPGRLDHFEPLPLCSRIAPLQDARSVLRLHRLLRRCNFAIVHSHGFKTALITRAVKGLLERMSAGTEHHPCFLFTVHNYLLSLQGDSACSRLLQTVHSHLSPLCDHYITVSRALRREILNQEKVAPERTSTIYNGIDLSPYAAQTEYRSIVNSSTLGLPMAQKIVDFPLDLNEKQPLVGCISRLTTHKGLFDLLEAFNQVKSSFPDAQLVIVGEGPLREKLEASISTMQLRDSVLLAGYRKDIPRLLSHLDLFVLPSRSEGLSMAVIEAMAAGLPIIATRTGGIPELIEDNTHGMLLPPGSPDGMAEKMIHLLSHPEKAVELGQRAHKRALANFSLQSMVVQTEKLYANLLEGGRGGLASSN